VAKEEPIEGGGVGVGVGLALARRCGAVARRRLNMASIATTPIANNLIEPNFISYFLSLSGE
jgi:hypothetical protein